MEVALLLCRVLHFTSAMLVFGAAAFPYYAGDEAAAAALLAARLRPVLLAAAAAALLSALAMVPCVAVQMAGTPEAAADRQTLSLVLLHTAFGRVWCWHLLLALMLAVAFLPRRSPPVGRLVLAALLLASLGLVGHVAVAGAGSLAIVNEANDAIHLLAAGLWLGGLLPLAIVAIDAARSADTRPLARLRTVLPRFSRLAYGAVALVLLTGLNNTALLVGGIGGLVDSDYGRLLLLKLSLVLLLLVVAAVNRAILTPRLDDNRRPRKAAAALCCTIAIEQALGLAIIAAVGLLGTLPPAHAHLH